MTRIEEVLANVNMLKDLSVEEEAIKFRCLQDINITLALIYDELRAIRYDGLKLTTPNVDFTALNTEESNESME